MTMELLIDIESQRTGLHFRAINGRQKGHRIGCQRYISTFSPYSFTLRETGPEDVVLKVLYCGIDHTDLHQMRSEIQFTDYPLVSGHEVVGEIVELGSEVKFNLGDKVGVGCIVGSCGECLPCKSNSEQYCNSRIFTHGGIYKDGTPTQGGYSSAMLLIGKKNQNSLLKILVVAGFCKNLTPDQAAPLLCAEVTAYIPLKAMGHHVTVISSSYKRVEALEHLVKKTITRNFLGSIIEMPEVQDFWAEKSLNSMIEVVEMDYTNKAFERMETNDVRYRFELDVAGSNLE
ncbi:hypothetical protein CRYUN_Cryun17cG0117500 [Craigia yunnanensis]